MELIDEENNVVVSSITECELIKEILDTHGINALDEIYNRMLLEIEEQNK